MIVNVAYESDIEPFFFFELSRNNSAVTCHRALKLELEDGDCQVPNSFG